MEVKRKPLNCIVIPSPRKNTPGEMVSMIEAMEQSIDAPPETYGEGVHDITHPLRHFPEQLIVGEEGAAIRQETYPFLVIQRITGVYPRLAMMSYGLLRVIDTIHVEEE